MGSISRDMKFLHFALSSFHKISTFCISRFCRVFLWGGVNFAPFLANLTLRPWRRSCFRVDPVEPSLAKVNSPECPTIDDITMVEREHRCSSGIRKLSKFYLYSEGGTINIRDNFYELKRSGFRGGRNHLALIETPALRQQIWGRFNGNTPIFFFVGLL